MEPIVHPAVVHEKPTFSLADGIDTKRALDTEVWIPRLPPVDRVERDELERASSLEGLDPLRFRCDRALDGEKADSAEAHQASEQGEARDFGADRHECRDLTCSDPPPHQQYGHDQEENDAEGSGDALKKSQPGTPRPE